MKPTKSIEMTLEIATLVSEYLNAEHAAKAQKARADRAKEHLLQSIGADPDEHCNYTVFNKSETTRFCITYTEGVTGYDSEDTAQEIVNLKARIKELENAHGIRAFKFYSMRERKA